MPRSLSRDQSAPPYLKNELKIHRVMTRYCSCRERQELPAASLRWKYKFLLCGHTSRFNPRWRISWVNHEWKKGHTKDGLLQQGTHDACVFPPEKPLGTFLASS